MDLRQDGYAFTQCFVAENIDLPDDYYFGMSASTNAAWFDDHDVHSMEVYEVDPPRRDRSKLRDVPKEVDKETKKVCID